MQIYSTAPAPVAPLDALSIGMQVEKAQTEVRKVDPSAALENKVLAVAGSSPKQTSDVLGINVVGFVHVQKVDAVGCKVTVLAPNGLPMPSTVLLQGDIEYVD